MKKKKPCQKPDEVQWGVSEDFQLWLASSVDSFYEGKTPLTDAGLNQSCVFKISFCFLWLRPIEIK